MDRENMLSTRKQQAMKAETNRKSNMWNRLILVAGAARSGTTWLNAILGTPEHVSYIRYEPLMVRRHPETPYGEKVLEWRSQPIWHRDPLDPEQHPYKDIILKHVEALCQHYFGGPVDTFIIKDPHPQYVPSLLDALAPDHVVVIRRHPLGVINSYDRENLYEKWSVPEKYRLFLESFQDLKIGYPPTLNSISSWSQMIAVMVRLSQNYLKKYLLSVPTSIVQYENLCLEPKTELQKIFHDLNWKFGLYTWDSMSKLIFPRSDQIGEGFKNIHKRSQQRAFAWREELAPIIIRKVERLYTDVGWNESFPGNGLPPLTNTEKRRAWVNYIHCRWKLLRKSDMNSRFRYLNP